MQILLKENWDTPITPPYRGSMPAGNIDFIGRAKEIELLKNDILRKDQGSILVSGHRGVGKTSFVYKVLQLIEQEKKAGTEMLYIYINAGQLDNNMAGAATEITTEGVLKTLIRRLYATSKDIFSASNGNDNPNAKVPNAKPDNAKAVNALLAERLNKLYRKAVAKEFNLKEVELNTNTNTVTKETTVKKEVSLSNIKLSQLAPVISAAALVAGAATVIFQPFSNEIINKIISCSLTLPVAGNLFYTSLSSNKSEEQTRLTAETLYQIDNNLSNLEYDLEEFHRLLKDSDIKIIYVIDELDKLSEDQIRKVLRYLKNLFTLSKAIFIFIGNEDLYDVATKEIDDNNFRPEYYTFFTSKYFIGRPTTDELKDYFFKKIAERVDTGDPALQRAAHYFAYESKGDLFNLVNTLKDHIARYEDGKPVIDLAINSPVVLKKSRLHKSISVVFFQTYYYKNFSRMRENEILYRQLIDYMYLLKEQASSVSFADPAEDNRLSSVKRDVNRFLSGINFFNKSGEQIIKINGADVQVSNYSTTGIFSADPPERMETLSENEKRLLSLAEEFLALLLPLVNTSQLVNSKNAISLDVLREKIVEFASGFEDLEITEASVWPRVFYDLQSEHIIDYSSDDIESCLNEISEVATKIQHIGFWAFKQLILQWFGKNGHQEATSTDSFKPINSFRTALYQQKLEWKDFFYVLPDANAPQWAFLFVRYRQGLETVLEQLATDEHFNSSVVLFVLQTSTDETEKLGQFFSHAGKANTSLEIDFIDVSAPANLPEEMKKCISAIETQVSIKRGQGIGRMLA